MLKNPIYAGWVKSGNQMIARVHEPIVPQPLFDKVQTALNNNSRGNVSRLSLRPDFPLKQFVRCAKCERGLTAGIIKKKFPYLWCYAKGCRAVLASKDKLETSFVTLLGALQPPVEYLNQQSEMAAKQQEVRGDSVQQPAGLDTFIDHLESGTAIILADMGAGSGQVASDWFDSMYEDVSATGARFTAVGVITPDPASVESVLAWANRLQDRVQYVVVQNATGPQSNFSYWDSAQQAILFRESLSPTVVRMEFRLAELENPARQHGVRLGQVAARQNSVDELKRASIVMRAESYRRRLFSEFDRAKEMFLP
jgi:hypothetical protein